MPRGVEHKVAIPRNVDHLEMPIEPSRAAEVGAKLAQAGELIGRALQIGELNSAQASATDGTIVLVLPCATGYCATALDRNGSSTTDLTTLSLGEGQGGD